MLNFKIPLQFQNKEDITERIEKLGGRVSSSGFTHLLTMKPNKGEKYMMAIAGGRFVLHLDFLKASEDAGGFIETEDYEFGSRTFLPSLPEKDKTDAAYHAPYKWRRWIDRHQRFSKGAFTDLTVIISAAPAKAHQFANVIRAGGGKFVEIDFTSSFKSAMIKRAKIDVALVDAPKLSTENQNVLEANNVKIIGIKSIHQYLMSDEAPKFIKNSL